MILVLDQGLARETVRLLKTAGVDAEHVALLGMATSDDDQILAYAGAKSRVIVTVDGDFHAILARNGALKPSVIRIRIEGLKAAEQSRVILHVLDVALEELEQGAVVSVDDWSIRVRLLPIGRPPGE